MISVISAISLFKWEQRMSSPFLDIKMLSSNPRLLSVFLQFAGLNIVFYSLFFCLPLWLDQVKGFDSKTTGMLMLPFAGLGVLMTPVAVRMNKRYGYRTTIIAGNVVLIFGTLLLLILGENSSLPVILMVTAVLGIPNGLNSMGLQTALYHVAKPEEKGIASGLFQTETHWLLRLF
ncbi:MFS transporter [Brevibacillus halotolerans]|uniref:MFS transporter n=1 Tax=Brevibacillus TaxID=55080 RepID=UPI00215CFD95|nr:MULTISPECIES: MFS transporter [Brevibacillus]MCR8966196.1 MFS transporter [Brevibacillus laterosporus]MCZ0838353.1 MFS transporter [Brevibacillus halotolerans]